MPDLKGLFWDNYLGDSDEHGKLTYLGSGTWSLLKGDDPNGGSYDAFIDTYGQYHVAIGNDMIRSLESRNKEFKSWFNSKFKIDIYQSNLMLSVD